MDSAEGNPFEEDVEMNLEIDQTETRKVRYWTQAPHVDAKMRG
jgi:hypothetical protein